MTDTYFPLQRQSVYCSFRNRLLNRNWDFLIESKRHDETHICYTGGYLFSVVDLISRHFEYHAHIQMHSNGDDWKTNSPKLTYHSRSKTYVSFGRRERTLWMKMYDRVQNHMWLNHIHFKVNKIRRFSWARAFAYQFQGSLNETGKNGERNKRIKLNWTPSTQAKTANAAGFSNEILKSIRSVCGCSKYGLRSCMNFTVLMRDGIVIVRVCSFPIDSRLPSGHSSAKMQFSFLCVFFSIYRIFASIGSYVSTIA